MAIPALASNRLVPMEYKRVTYTADIPANVTVEDILEPSYWAHLGRTLRPGDRIDALAEDNKWMAYLHVFATDATWVRVGLIYVTVFNENTILPASQSFFADFIVEHSGNYHKWRVRRKKDDEILISQLATEDQARDWLKEYKKTFNTTTKVKSDAA